MKKNGKAPSKIAHNIIENNSPQFDEKIGLLIYFLKIALLRNILHSINCTSLKCTT